MIFDLQYIFEILASGGLFYLLYKLVLESRADYKACRIYLMLSTITSALLPLAEIPIYTAGNISFTFPTSMMGEMPMEAAAETAESSVVNTDYSWILSLVYHLVLSSVFIVLVRNFRKIASLRKGTTLSRETNYILAENKAVMAAIPFSVIKADELN